MLHIPSDKPLPHKELSQPLPLPMEMASRGSTYTRASWALKPACLSDCLGWYTGLGNMSLCCCERFLSSFSGAM